MATINFLYRSKKDTAPLTIRLLYRHEGKDFVFGVRSELLIERDYWSKVHNAPTRDVKIKNKQTLINTELNKIETYVLEEVKSYGLDRLNKKILAGIVKRYYNPEEKKVDQDVLTERIKIIIETADLKENDTGGLGLSKNRVKAYGQLLRVVEEFQGDKIYKIKDVNLRFALDFKNYLLKNKRYGSVTAMKYLSDVKTVCFEAERLGVEVSPQLRFIKRKTIKNEFILFLTREEIEKVKSTHFEEHYLKNAKKWLLLGVSVGQRGGDLLDLTKENFITRGGLSLIELKQKKTGKQITIPVLEETEEIKRSGLPHKISTQKLNNYIKEVCKRSGIDEPTEGLKMNPSTLRKEKGTFPKWELVSTHICRRTFASNLYGELPTPLIMSITGHSTEKMLLSYIGKTSMDYAQQIADFYSLREKKKEPVLTVVGKKLKSG